jgi:hypothetical protein
MSLKSFKQKKVWGGSSWTRFPSFFCCRNERNEQSRPLEQSRALHGPQGVTESPSHPAVGTMAMPDATRPAGKVSRISSKKLDIGVHWSQKMMWLSKVLSGNETIYHLI